MTAPHPLFFKKFGHGQNILIFFHGFGQDHHAWNKLVAELPDNTCAYTLDLPHHGQSFKPTKPLSQKDWLAVFSDFLASENILNFSLIAYSLGGRFALYTFQKLAHRINQVILIAPDGFHQHFWYRVATSPLINSVFRYLMYHPEIFNKWLNFFEQIKWVPQPLIKFARKELQSKKRCIQVYYTWTHFKPIQPDLQLINQLSHQNSKKIHLILGTRDSIINPEKIVEYIPTNGCYETHLFPLKHHELLHGTKTVLGSLIKGDEL